ncbi:T9SS sorting signal type C domain-containing protein [Flavobacterium sp.]|uniref:T9SS sorting signal type C domain-containing protein n=1 Tax=Flavobacterium sp. TaxID=239 RepID=UPI002B4B469A|nr:T9SS sorting signal type C domain-containing protein [Flavobacterium sp.]HLF52343.1 T9SS sorting signal type C domain-containing protein [Flavobacterium sp.]
MDKILHLFSNNRTIFILLLILSNSSFTLCAQTTNTFTAINSNWNTAANWSLNHIPTSAEDAVIPLGKTVNIDVSSAANSISISGILKLNDQKTLTIGHNFTVNLGGAFYMPGGQDVATLVVYGNFYNYGVSSFWKSNVIICGDLITPSTSSLQNSGIVVVGGNIIGDFSLTGSAGNIYALNPNATVSITPSSVDSTVIPGADVPASEGAALITLINQAIYSGSCPFTVSDVMDVTACAGSNAIFTVSTSGASPQYQWQVKTNANNDWNNLVNNAVYSGVFTATLTITSVDALMNGYKYRALITSSSCVSSGNNGKLILTAGPPAPIVGLITQPTCTVTTGSVVLSGLPLSGILNPGNISYSGTSCTVSGLVPGTYNFTITTNSCNSVGSAAVVIVPLATTTWNGSSWSNGLPSSDKNIVFNGDYTSFSDITACSCTVNPGTNVIVNSGNTLIMSNAITVAGGTITLENNASLIQTNDASINTGNITVKRKSAPMKLYDYTYWSSPVQNWKLNQLSPNTGYYYSFDPLTNNWAGTNGGNQVMTAGKGYIIRAPQGWSTTNATLGVYNGNFIGVPNTGIIPITIQKGAGTFNLIGNPYPSAIDIDLFLSDPANSNIINGTVYIWTHNTAISSTIPGNATYNYTSDDYAKYNLTGGVKTALTSITGLVTPNGKIASGQGFFIEANSALANGTYTASFKNSMRIAGNNNQFFRTATAPQSATNTIEKNRIWLNISNPQGAYNETLLGYVTGATNGFDNLHDGKTFPAGNVLSLYSVVGTDNYSIQGRALPFNASEIIPMGYSTTLSGTFTIAIENLDGFFIDQNVYLLDKSNNTTHNLKTSAYSFTTATGTFNNRFELRFTTATLGNENPVLNENTVTIYPNDKQINIKSTLTMESVIVYDILGRQLFNANKINAMNFQTTDLTATNQVLIVKVKFADNYEVSKKVMIN